MARGPEDQERWVPQLEQRGTPPLRCHFPLFRSLSDGVMPAVPWVGGGLPRSARLSTDLSQPHPEVVFDSLSGTLWPRQVATYNEPSQGFSLGVMKKFSNQMVVVVPTNASI